MRGVNRVIILGTVGRDPELKDAGTTKVCTFLVAVNERQKKGGEWIDSVEWFSIVAFGKIAENAAKYLAKGSTAYVEGRLQTDKWTAKDGAEKTAVKVIAENVQFLGEPKAKKEPPRLGGPRPAAGDDFPDDGEFQF